MNPARLWPLAIVGVLAITVGANAWILYEANRDPNAQVVEPDYYGRAVAYNSTLAQERRDAVLGWRLTAAPGAFRAAGTPITLALADRDGRAIAGAAVTLLAIHNLDAGRVVSARCVTGSDGLATARLALDRTGLWELRLDARSGAARFTSSTHVDVAGGPR
jgi:nitrogen fixation protein FixH